MKRLFTSLTILVAVVAATALAGCGTSDAEAVKAVAEEDLATVSQISESGDWAAVVDASQLSEFTDAGLDPSQFAEALLTHFSYQVGDPTVTGTAATVAVKVTNIDMASIVSKWSTEIANWTTSSEATSVYNAGGDSAVTKYVLNRLVELMAADDAALTSGDVELHYQLEDGTWTLTDDSDQMQTVILAGQSVEDAF